MYLHIYFNNNYLDFNNIYSMNRYYLEKLLIFILFV